MGLIASIIVGLIAGFVASKLMKTNTSLFIDMLLGIAGSILGGWVTSLLLGVDLTSGVNLTTIIVSILGATLVIFIYRLIKR
ncbi:MAG: GlsB/YeaQ/YmgE family stress response membrane protein, partial [Anaerolineaceae bacterium]|nr:GlsB/YeaQ/YmgE family stress response membrane protein [Anaerolineaceae bacterium]